MGVWGLDLDAHPGPTTQELLLRDLDRAHVGAIADSRPVRRSLPGHQGTAGGLLLGAQAVELGERAGAAKGDGGLRRGGGGRAGPTTVGGVRDGVSQSTDRAVPTGESVACSRPKNRSSQP